MRFALPIMENRMQKKKAGGKLAILVCRDYGFQYVVYAGEHTVSSGDTRCALQVIRFLV